MVLYQSQTRRHMINSNIQLKTKVKIAKKETNDGCHEYDNKNTFKPLNLNETMLRFFLFTC